MKIRFRLPVLMLSLLMVAAASFMFTSCSKDDPLVDGMTPAEQAAYAAADGVKGARLYDHVLNEVGITDATMTSKPNFFRCKSCHGWDLKGRTGVLINKASSDTYPVVADVNLVDEVRLNDNPKEIFEAIQHMDGRDPKSGTYTELMPRYNDILSTQDIWDLVKFIKVTGHQTNDFYTLNTTGTYPNGTKSFSNIGKNGNAAAGKVTYDAKCAVCHGADGSTINVYCKGIWMGDMFREDPHEIQHKALWGMPMDNEHVNAGCLDAGEMPATGITDDDIRNIMVMGQDETAFPGFH